jgi:hypothetical protein
MCIYRKETEYILTSGCFQALMETIFVVVFTKLSANVEFTLYIVNIILKCCKIAFRSQYVQISAIHNTDRQENLLTFPLPFRSCISRVMKFKILIFILTFFCQPTDSQVPSQCEDFNYCSNHGYCMNGGIECMCSPPYDGVNCSVCAVGYFNYPWCYACKLSCRNGGICSNDTCVCPTNTTDIFCSNCAPTFNGQYCTQDPIGFSVITNGTVYDIGGAYITIMGAHFNTHASNVRCRFQDYEYSNAFFGYSGGDYYSSSGAVINGTALSCVTDRMRAASYIVSFSLDNGTSWFSDGYEIELGRLRLTVTAYCPATLNKCSNNGNCEYGNCSCFWGFDGEQCDRCAEGFYEYPLCISCDACQNIDKCINGTCICAAPYSGPRCTECPLEYNGKSCLRIPMILSVSPNVIYDVGGANLTVTISNFDENITNVICKFQSDYYDGNFTDISCGYILNRTTLSCLTPRMNTSSRRLSVSMSNGITWIDSSIYIFVNGTCPNRCYQGSCSFGECICVANYVGPSCSSCALGYYNSPDCYPCFYCEQNNGTCDYANDRCICGDPVRFTGTFCGQCQPIYYGVNCMNISQLASIQPDVVSDFSVRDGVNITLTGVNFFFASLVDVICQFQTSLNSTTWTVSAISANTSTVVCILSVYAQSEAYVSISLSLDNGVTWVETSDQRDLYVNIDTTCPMNYSCYHGTCSFGNCTCYSEYTGISCDRCPDGYYSYPDCYSCLYCGNNGTCVNGTCVCAERYAGTFCSQCQSHYYGNQCLQIPILLSVSPSQVPDVGGVNLTVMGDHFDENSSSVLCQFCSDNYPCSVQMNYGNVINRTALNCLAPRMNSSWYQLFASTDNGTTWIDSYVYIFVQGTCPNGSNCYFGRCSFGDCICNMNPTGPTCSSCVVGYYNFPNCYSCSYCAQNNGTCDNAADKCICGDPVRFTGTFCNQCQPDHYGVNCTNNSQLLGVSSICGLPMSTQSTLNSSFMTTLIETTQVTSPTSVSIVSNSHSSTAVIPTVTTNFYIQFTLTLSINNGNMTAYQISFQLLAIFTSALDIYSNQINIIVTILPVRTLTNAAAQVRLFNSAAESADSLLTRTRQQLDDSSSLFRQDDLTSQLTSNSISDVKKIYICDDNTEQETPCQVATTTQSASTNSRTTILLAAIIPSIIGALIIGVIIVLVVRYVRQRSKSSSSRDQSYHDFSN